MPRKRREGPWLYSHTGTYYAWINGKRTPLKTKDESEAWARYHELRAGGVEKGEDATVGAMIDAFLDFSRKENAPRTYETYKRFLDTFPDTKIKVHELRKYHATKWLHDEFDHGSPNTRAGAVRSLKRVFNWAVDEGLLQANPVARLKAPKYLPRQVYITDEQWETVLADYDESDPFHLLLTMVKLTGCRPQEIRAVEARHFRRDLKAWVFPVEESKGKRHNRTIYLIDEAIEITERLIEENPTGPLLRNKDGNPWKTGAIADRFRRLRQRLLCRLEDGEDVPGFENEEQIEGLCCYAIRHKWITDALANGVQSTILRRLTGHQSAAMIDKVYGHPDQRPDVMQEALNIATNGKPTGGRPA